MRVKVVIPEHKRASYGGERVRNGDIIDVNPHHYSERWMERIKKKPGPKPKQPTLSLNKG